MRKLTLLAAGMIALAFPAAAQEIDITPASIKDGFGNFGITLTGSYEVLGSETVTFAPALGHQLHDGRYWAGGGVRIAAGDFFVTGQVAYSFFSDTPAAADGEDDVSSTAFSAVASAGYALFGPIGIIVRADAPLGADERLGLDDVTPTIGLFLRL